MSKQRVIVEAVLSGKSQREVAALYGVSQPRVSQLVAAWREGGWEALEPRPSRPRTNPNATPPDVVDRIVALRHELVTDGADAGPHTIAALLARDGAPVPSVTTIWRILTRSGAIVPEPRKRPKRSYVRFAADLPNECWQADFTHWALADGRDVEILLWLDDHSRFLISATAHAPVTGPLVVATFRAACTTHGTPASTLTDNGMVFTTRYRGGPNGFETLLADLGVAQKNGSPNHPQTQGKVERLNQTLKRWLHARPRATTLGDLQTQLEDFTDYYNTRRPHRSLDRATPAEAYTALAGGGQSSVGPRPTRPRRRRRQPRPRAARRPQGTKARRRTRAGPRRRQRRTHQRAQGRPRSVVRERGAGRPGRPPTGPARPRPRGSPRTDRGLRRNARLHH